MSEVTGSKFNPTNNCLIQGLTKQKSWPHLCLDIVLYVEHPQGGYGPPTRGTDRTWWFYICTQEGATKGNWNLQGKLISFYLSLIRY